MSRRDTVGYHFADKLPLPKPVTRTVGMIPVSLSQERYDRIFGKGDPNPETADEPGEWVEVTCKNHECPEYQQFETSVAEPVYDVLPPSCPCCGHELEAI